MQTSKLRHAAIAFLSCLVVLFYIDEVKVQAGSFALADTSAVMAMTPDWDYDFETGWNSEYGQGGLANQNPAAQEWRYAQMQTTRLGSR